MLSRKIPKRKILQIIPAPNWFAVYIGDGDCRDLDGNYREPDECWWPLVCWALIKNEVTGETEIVGMDSGGCGADFCGDVTGFVEYRHRAEMQSGRACVFVTQREVKGSESK